VSKIYSIKCPNCAGALKLLGGGRVETITCEYCKSLIDINDNYKILSNFKNIKVPKVPFEIGMSGKIEDIEWTIIGWIVYRDEEDYNDRWSEFLLFSPLYGYAWLIYEEGDISFSRRVRDFNLQKWQKDGSNLFYRNGHYLIKDESYNSLVDFVQGELTWIAKRDDKIRCWDYKKTSRESLTIERSGNELEVYYTKKVDTQEVYESFGVDKEQQIIRKRSFSEKMDEELEDGKPLSFYGIIFIMLTLIALLVSSFTSDKVLYEKISSDSNYNFTVHTSAFLTQMTIKSTSPTTLNGYRFEIYKSNKKIFYIDKKVVYFSKATLGKTWSHNAIGAKIYFKLDSGRYLLKVIRTDKTVSSPIAITVEEKVIRDSYILPILILVVLFFLYLIVKRASLIYKIAFGLMILGGLFGISYLFLIGLFILLYAYSAKKGSSDD
jgi:hypothetical protein